MQRITAPANPKVVSHGRISELRVKKNRTPAEVAELINLLAERVLELETRLGE